jgi:hypothetical protein
VRTFRYLFPLLTAFLLVPGCSDDPGSLTQGANPYAGDPGGGADDDGQRDPPSGTPAPPPPADTTFGTQALARARQWIDADMPYCGGPNGGKDVICGGTCTRSGAAKDTDWDAYRSDCSGFVSWSWGLPAPGLTTRTLAPYDTKQSALITVDDLEPGDALNGAGHVMLFGGWADKAAGKALVLQESRCGTTAHEQVSVFKVVDSTTLQISDGRNYRPIRYKNASAASASAK